MTTLPTSATTPDTFSQGFIDLLLNLLVKIIQKSNRPYNLFKSTSSSSPSSSSSSSSSSLVPPPWKLYFNPWLRLKPLKDLSFGSYSQCHYVAIHKMTVTSLLITKSVYHLFIYLFIYLLANLLTHLWTNEREMNKWVSEWMNEWTDLSIYSLVRACLFNTQKTLMTFSSITEYIIISSVRWRHAGSPKRTT